MNRKQTSCDNEYDFTANRLFLEHALSPDTICACLPAQANYLLNVLRLRDGESIYVFNGVDGEWRAEIVAGRKNSCTLRIVERTRLQSVPQDLEYIFAPVKRARLDYMVQKAVELGVSSLRPVITQHTIVDRVNLERMKANAIEAAEQCGILNIPAVHPPGKLSKLLDSWSSSARTLIFCDEAAATKSPVERLGMLERQPVSVLIGPEGGFDRQERDRLLNMENVVSLSLGPRIMRADTAAVAALTLVNAVLGDWNVTA